MSDVETEDMRHIVVATNPDVMRCNACCQMAAMPLGEVEYVMGAMTVFMNLHRKCAGHVERTAAIRKKSHVAN